MASPLKSPIDYLTTGDAILARITGKDAIAKPKTSAAAAKAFADVHGRYRALSSATSDAGVSRDERFADVTARDGELDALVDALADAIVGEGLGKRGNPFASFSRYAPAQVRKLPHAIEVTEVGKLVAAVDKKASSAGVKKATAACTKAAAAVTKAIAAVAPAQAKYSKALHARDAILPEWTTALGRFKRFAQVDWIDEPETYRAVFAAPGGEARPVKRRAKKKGAPADGAPAPTTPAMATSKKKKRRRRAR